MNFSSLIFENDNEQKKYLYQVAKETLKDLFASNNIDPVSFKDIGEFKFSNNKIEYFISITTDRNKILFWFFVKDDFATLVNWSGEKYFSDEEDYINIIKEIGERTIKSSQETKEKIIKIENVFEEFFQTIKASLSENYIFSKKPLSVKIFENNFEVTKKSTIFYGAVALGDLSVTYDGDTKMPSPDIYLNLAFEEKNYKTFDQLLSLGKDFVIQTLIRKYGK